MQERNEFGFAEMLREHALREQRAAENLDGLPFSHQTFSANEITRLMEIGVTLANYKRENSTSVQELKNLIEYLNGLEVWDARFSTSGGGENQENDSLYFVTKSNISLRLKRSNLDKGMEKVIEPFMENIVFLPADGHEAFYPLEHPSLGATPSEYSSQEFNQLQQRDEGATNFKLKIPRFFKEGKLYFVGKPDNLFHEHIGSEINNVYYTKSNT